MCVPGCGSQRTGRTALGAARLIDAASQKCWRREVTSVPEAVVVRANVRGDDVIKGIVKRSRMKQVERTAIFAWVLGTATDESGRRGANKPRTAGRTGEVAPVRVRIGAVAHFASDNYDGVVLNIGGHRSWWARYVVNKFRAEAMHDRYRELRDSGKEYAASRGEFPHGL